MNRMIVFLAVMMMAAATFSAEEADEKVLTMRKDIYEDTIANGIRHYRAEDYDKAFDLLGRTAVQGDKESQYLIGVMYLKGQGVEKHTLRGLAWMQTGCEAKMKDWTRDYNKIIEKLNKQQISRVDKLAAEYIRLYGMAAQQVTCKKRDMHGSYLKRYVCQKEAGWVLKGEWDLPSLREFEQYHVNQ